MIQTAPTNLVESFTFKYKYIPRDEEFVKQTVQVNMDFSCAESLKDETKILDVRPFTPEKSFFINPSENDSDARFCLVEYTLKPE